ncbi:structural protein [Pseudomonas phage vB_PcuM_ KLEP17-4]|nr:structural protein [Pseudomonas phage vB_PcuM_ KLEP17-4]
MANLTPTPAETPVPQLETTTIARGGFGGPMNMQAQALLNRDALRAEQILAVGQLAEDLNAELRDDFSDNTDPEKGSGIPAWDYDLPYAEETSGARLKEAPTENSLWAGFFGSWVMGFSSVVGAAERVQIPAGVTHGRAGFAAGTTIFQSGVGQMRIQRNAGGTETANHTVCMNLTDEETAPLRGKRCTAHIFARAGANYSGAGVTLRVQHSVEPEQPVLSSVAQYSNGHAVTASVTFVPGAAFPGLPQSLTFDVPEDATQVALALVIPFSGTAGTFDYVEFQEAAIYVAPARRAVRQASDMELEALGATRYQTSYPYASSFGANSTAGSVTAISGSTATAWALAANVRFSPRMIIPPRFQFLAPGSGTRSRLLDVAAGTFLSGLAYDISDSGVTVTNSAAAVANTRYAFQWSADCLF